MLQNDMQILLQNTLLAQRFQWNIAKPVEQWHHVLCRHSRVTSLDLKSVRQMGTTMELARLHLPTSLQTLSVEQNAIENVVRELPPLHCTYVVNLNLSHNYISVCPPVWKLPSTLRTLDLSYNHLTTKSLTHLCAVLPTTLESLQLGHNNITGTSELHTVCFPVSLKYLDLSYNYLSSSAVAGVHLPPGLRTLIMHHCLITSAIQTIALPRSLLRLNMSHNNISTISQLELPRQLRCVDLASNTMTRWSDIPIKLPVSLQELHLEDNFFCTSGSHAALIAQTLIRENYLRHERLVDSRTTIFLCLTRLVHRVSNTPALLLHIIMFWTPDIF